VLGFVFSFVCNKLDDPFYIIYLSLKKINVNFFELPKINTAIQSQDEKCINNAIEKRKLPKSNIMHK
jgi:hypothetical protein